jgi:hypothetical protein
VEVVSFKEHSATMIVIEVPQATALSGKVILHTSEGDIESKSLLGIAEPITITSISPNPARPGEAVTITGTYLNLISELTFSTKKTVTDFEDQSQTQIVVIVPSDAQTGSILLSDGEEVPTIVESEEFTVTTPAVTSLTPATIRAGANLTVTGTNLDLVKDITFTGNTRVTEFVSQSATEIVVKVADNAQDGIITIRPASQVEVPSTATITMVRPVLGNITPNPAKNGANITVTGTDLDLISSVEFGGGKMGEIQGGGTASSITVKVPKDAVDGTVKFSTKSNTSVSSANPVTLVVPTITSISPTSVNTIDEPSITINGTNLDLVAKVVFNGDWVSTKATGSDTQLTLDVVPGSVSGKIKLITSNGTEVLSGQSLTINADVPSIPSAPASAFLGSVLSLSGTNMNVPADIIFPGDIKATMFGSKTSSLIEVFVPLTVPQGLGKIKFVTDRNEVYETAEINFKLAGVEPVQSASLVFFDFNGSGAKDSWWGAVTLVSDANSIDGTSYGRLNGTYTGWNDMFWRNAKNNFPAATIGTNVDDYVLKFDIRILEPITGGNLKFKLGGPQDSEFWWGLGPAAPGSDGSTVPAANWTTITVPISAFKDNWGWGSNSPTDLNNITGNFGCSFDNGNSIKINVMIDNVRFHKIN